MKLREYIRLVREQCMIEKYGTSAGHIATGIIHFLLGLCLTGWGLLSILTGELDGKSIGLGVFGIFLLLFGVFRLFSNGNDHIVVNEGKLLFLHKKEKLDEFELSNCTYRLTVRRDADKGYLQEANLYIKDKITGVESTLDCTFLGLAQINSLIRSIENSGVQKQNE
jgi:hypothetical protein